MAGIKPFRGVRYNTERFDDMQAVVSQPYDRVRHGLQDKYYALSPHTIVRIIKGKEEEGDILDAPEGPNVYTRAKACYEQWLKESILVREGRPALYAYEQTFTVGGKEYVRRGMIAAVELAEFEEGTILPHERTHSGPKVDRLRLLSTMEVDTWQIFMLYPDEENKINALLYEAIGRRVPDINVVELFENTVRQRVWAITDPDTIAAIQAEMAPKRNLIIADGHHRYETGLNYRNTQRRAYPDAPADAAFNYIQATLVSMDDPGLVVLPTHREIRNFTATSPADILKRAEKHFVITPAANLDACLSTVNADPNGHAFGFYGGKELGFRVLTLKDSSLADTLIAEAHSHEWKSLSVSILHRILLDQIAGVPSEGIEDKSMIRYHRDAQMPVNAVDAGEANFVFFLSPTRMAHIKACTSRGEKMPQKSTDFYPKVISGLTLLPVDLGEHLP